MIVVLGDGDTWMEAPDTRILIEGQRNYVFSSDGYAMDVEQVIDLEDVVTWALDRGYTGKLRRDEIGIKSTIFK